MKTKLLIALVSLLSAASASATLIYENDFSRNARGFSGGMRENGQYVQRDTDSVINFRLNDARINSAVNLMFDVNAIGTWDRSGHLEDFFVVIDRIRGASNVELFNDNLRRGTNSFMFEDVAAFREDQLRIRFVSTVTGRDELFALDNFKVSAVSVAEPATLVLLGLGLVGAGLRRRV